MLSHPVLNSMREHLAAVREFERCAIAAPSVRAAMHHVNAGIYSLRACVDNLRSAARRGQLTHSVRALDAWLDHEVPQLRLVRKLRNYHFHEEAIYGPPRMRIALKFVVPALSTATVGVTVNPSAPEFKIDGAMPGTAEYFLVSGLLVQDEREVAPVSIPSLLRQLPAQLEARLGAVALMFRRAPA